MSNRSVECGSEGLTGLMEIKCGVFSEPTFCSSTLSFFLSFFLSAASPRKPSSFSWIELLQLSTGDDSDLWHNVCHKKKVADCTKGQTWWYSFIKERECERLSVALPAEVMRWLLLFRARQLNWILKTGTMRQFFSVDFFYSPFIFMVVDISPVAKKKNRH